jgi:hypothetical protein
MMEVVVNKSSVAMEMVKQGARWFQRKSDEVSVTLTPIEGTDPSLSYSDSDIDRIRMPAILLDNRGKEPL